MTVLNFYLLMLCAILKTIAYANKYKDQVSQGRRNRGYHGHPKFLTDQLTLQLGRGRLCSTHYCLPPLISNLSTPLMLVYMTVLNFYLLMLCFVISKTIAYANTKIKYYMDAGTGGVRGTPNF